MSRTSPAPIHAAPPRAGEPSANQAVKFSAILLLHGAALWWLGQQPLRLLTPAQPLRMEVRTVELAPPAPPAPPRPMTAPPRPLPQAVARPQAVPAPPVMTAAPSAAPAPSSFAVAPQPPAPPVAEPSPPAPGPVTVTAPRFDANYLHNPAPVYPPMSRRLGEAGRVLLLVKVTAQGTAESVQVKTSCGHPRLDEAAQAAVRNWRFVPARRGDEPVAASVVVPIVFQLDN